MAWIGEGANIWHVNDSVKSNPPHCEDLAPSSLAAACTAGMLIHVLPAGARFDPPTGVAALPDGGRRPSRRRGEV
jgi:hypothetical protein